MEHLDFYANGVLLPSPVSLSIDRNKIWSDNAGRSVTAKMIGDIIAKKKKFAISWHNIKESDFEIIEENLSTITHPFVDFKIQNSENLKDYINVKVYDGVLKTPGVAPYFYDGELLYKDVSAELVEQ
jgi:hypothetical protein